MNRTAGGIVLTVIALIVLRSWGWLEGPAERIVDWILALAFYFFFPLLILAVLYAPGLFRAWVGNWGRSFDKLFAPRRELQELRRKIDRLDKPHHMAQLGNALARRSRWEEAIRWYEQALDRDDSLLDARYRMALCHLNLQHVETATQLLEEVHREKPDHDYGLAYLRLAQAQHRLGNLQRADEVFAELLRFYPGHPEGSYSYARLKEEQGDLEKARALMRELIEAARFSPRFQRRRNRHWMLRAHYWLWRN